jgi:hypothetical protein
MPLQTFAVVARGINDMQVLFGQGPATGGGQIGIFSGTWQPRGTSVYFNCGFAGEPPPVNYVTLQNGIALETWFVQTFLNDRPNVLKDADKWNFTLVLQNWAFNFHLRVQQ